MNLGVFDYLCTATARLGPSATRPEQIYFIGNLAEEKSAFLYTQEDLGSCLELYGPNYSQTMARGHEPGIYRGVLNPDNPKLGKRDGFGLVWDGTSPNRLQGMYGEYLFINTPHKLSLYLALGLPVLVPATSACAAFVQETGVGLTIDTLADMQTLLAAVEPETWSDMLKAVDQVRARLLGGFYTLRALTEATANLKSAGGL